MNDKDLIGKSMKNKKKFMEDTGKCGITIVGCMTASAIATLTIIGIAALISELDVQQMRSIYFVTFPFLGSILSAFILMGDS